MIHKTQVPKDLMIRLLIMFSLTNKPMTQLNIRLILSKELVTNINETQLNARTNDNN